MIFLKKLYYSKYKKTSYAISNVDLIIDRIFSKINKGIYVDVGCNHPIKYNNTYLLYKKGWNGINVDSDEKSISSTGTEEGKYSRPAASVAAAKSTVYRCSSTPML